MPKTKTAFICSECGNTTYNWAGKCPSCGQWNSLKEIIVDTAKKTSNKAFYSDVKSAKKINEINETNEIRFSTGIPEFDRVLGGGAVQGSMILVGGSPGIGKSTLLLQMCQNIDNSRKVLYVSGEESERQLKLRASRLEVMSDSLYVLSETNLDSIINSIEDIKPDILIIDSIQTISDDSKDSTPGSITQVRDCTIQIMRIAKEKNITVFIVGHINKEGSIAGPKVLEHMVDCVLYFEGENNTAFRLLRAIKNRYGSTNEIGVFEMADKGLICVENPSEMLLLGRPENASGTCVTCIIEGSRPILAEIQALVTPAAYNASRRLNGIDFNRASMLIAVTEKRGELKVLGCDTYINVIGGLMLDEPAADLATVLAISSSFLDIPLGSDLAAIGEVGLSGEIRSVSSINQRLSEISRLGFKRCMIPSHIRGKLNTFDNLELIPVKNVYEAIRKAANR